MHSSDRLLRALENAPVQPFSGFVYRIIAERHRDSPLSAIGSVRSGGRYNAPNSFPVLYCADSQMTALLEVEALFTTADGQLKGAPRDPDLVLSLRCELARVLDLTDESFLRELGTTSDELVNLTPSRFILNARGEETPTQTLGSACSFCGSISAVKVPSAANNDGYCLNILPDSLLVGEHVTILDDSDRIKAKIDGVIPVPGKFGGLTV
ncbi:RES family NAD+ phosphorylase [Granulicella sp. L60]|uniref:RES family NAD+ phosphorylase n=1 Tax=Granulicella sp. L60 TaxID=1641866 RepID=UPI00131D6883|nr:RES family NAD+ phosphorylase [Granulicella sp. L60]